MGTSKHQIALFKYLINAKYADRVSEIKAYPIAIDVFGRSSDFDSADDSIVRVEMFRLRANLREFNQLSGKFKLELPKASYNIRITDLSVEIPDDSNRNEDLHMPQPVGLSRSFAIFTTVFIVGVAAFFLGRSSGVEGEVDYCSKTLPNVSIVNSTDAFDLENYVEQTVRGAASQFSQINLVNDVTACRDSGSPGYEIQYSVHQDKTSYRTILSAVSDSDRQVIASRNFSGPLDSLSILTVVQNDSLYYNLVTAVNDLIKPYGAVTRHAVGQVWENEAARMDFSCITTMYDSFISDSNEAYLRSLSCLERAYTERTLIQDNLGGLATSYIEQHQKVRPDTVENPLNAAKAIIEVIGDNWDQQVETTVAKIFYEAERPDYNSQRMLVTLMTAEKKYDTNPTILLEVSIYGGFRLGDWAFAKQVSDRVKLVHSERDNSVYLVDAAYALLFDDSQSALNVCVKTYSENSVFSNLLVNACALKMENQTWFDKSESNLRQLGIKTPAAKIDFINNRQYDEVFKEEVIRIWETHS